MPEGKFFKSKFLNYCRSMYLLIMCHLLAVTLVDQQVRDPMDTWKKKRTTLKRAKKAVVLTTTVIRQAVLCLQHDMMSKFTDEVS